MPNKKKKASSRNKPKDLSSTSCASISILKKSRDDAKQQNPLRATRVKHDKAKKAHDTDPNDASKKQNFRLHNILPRLETLPDAVKNASKAFANTMLTLQIILLHNEIIQHALSNEQHLPKSTFINFKLTCIKELEDSEYFRKLRA